MFSPFFAHFVHSILKGFLLDTGRPFFGWIKWYFSMTERWYHGWFSHCFTVSSVGWTSRSKVMLIVVLSLSAEGWWGNRCVLPQCLNRRIYNSKVQDQFRSWCCCDLESRSGDAFIAVGKRLKGVMIDDSFIKNEFVIFVLWYCLYRFSGWTSCDFVWVVEC